MSEPCQNLQCPYRQEVERLRGRLAELEGQQAVLQRHVFGKRSERMPSLQRQIDSERDETQKRQDEQQKRREHQKSWDELPARNIVHEVPAEQRKCPKCGGHDLKPLGNGRQTVVFEYVPEHLERQVHVQQVLSCPCGQYIVTAPGPDKVVDKGSYGPGLIGHLVTMKCADAIPLHRLSRQFERHGIVLSRSTLTQLFHAAGQLLRALRDRLLELIAARYLVMADETVLKMQAKEQCRKGYMWTFVAPSVEADEPFLVAYRFAASRSGQTPSQVLGGSAGVLLVDAYTGYNSVCVVDGRQRAGCMAHCRRKFFDALPSATEAQWVMDRIADLYRVEDEAKQRGIATTAAHLDLRQQKSRPITENLKQWLQQQQPLHPPRSPLGQAIGYALNQWQSLTLFLTDARIPLDNNLSEGQLRIVALGRKNFLFVGHEQAGDNLAVLISLVATCLAHGVNPQAYLADVLLRVQSHPARLIDELLPQHWKPPPITSTA